jgi:hypothetical protein
MVWLGACTKVVLPLVVFDEGTVDPARYIKKVLPVALKFGNKVFGNDWVFQQDVAKSHNHHLTQERCMNNFHSFIRKGHCSPESPDSNLLDYRI